MFSARVQPSHCRVKQDRLQQLPLPLCIQWLVIYTVQVGQWVGKGGVYCSVINIRCQCKLD